MTSVIIATYQRCGLGLSASVSRCTNVSSQQRITTPRSRLFASRAQDVILPKLVWTKGTKYCTDFLSLSKQGVYAWSRLHVIALYNLIFYIIIVIINGCENKVTTAIIITRRPRPILTFRWHLVTYKCLISVLSRRVMPTSRSRLGL